MIYILNEARESWDVTSPHSPRRTSQRAVNGEGLRPVYPKQNTSPPEINPFLWVKQRVRNTLEVSGSDAFPPKWLHQNLSASEVVFKNFFISVRSLVSARVRPAFLQTIQAGNQSAKESIFTPKQATKPCWKCGHHKCLILNLYWLAPSLGRLLYFSTVTSNVLMLSEIIWYRGRQWAWSFTYKLCDGVSSHGCVGDPVLSYGSFGVIPADGQGACGGVKHAHVPGTSTGHCTKSNRSSVADVNV